MTATVLRITATAVLTRNTTEPLFGGLRLCVTLKKLCTVHITTAMPTKHRYFLFIKTMIFHTVLCTFSLFQELQRNIGRMLGLDLDLIEAVALGHDIGHTPFGHAGENS